MTSSRLSTVLLSVGCTALVGGGAYAIGAASSSKTISACAKKKGGALRLAKTCKPNERKVSWNQQGPPGAAGTPGAAGAAGTAGTAGAKGDTGPSGTANLGEMTTTFATSSTTIGPGSPFDKSTISSPPLPAGSYAIQANVDYQANVSAFAGTTARAAAVCKLSINTDDNLGYDQRKIGSEVGFSAGGGSVGTTDFSSSSFLLTADVPEGAKAQILCDAEPTNTAGLVLANRFIITERLKSQTQGGADPVNTN